MSAETFAVLRQHMLAEISAGTLLLRGSIGKAAIDERVMTAMDKVPRHEFVPVELQPLAYANIPLPIGFDKTISQPFIVALMTDLLDIGADDVVLEIGTGLGYQAAILAQLARKVYSIEIIEELGQQAKLRLREQGCGNIELRIANGYHGWSEHAPFDKVIVTAAPDLIPPPLIHQLKAGGKMVIPAGLPDAQQLVLLEKDSSGRVTTKEILQVRFSQLEAAMPVIGFLLPTSADADADRLRGFHRSLKDSGYRESENVAIAYRFAENQIDRLPELAADLVRRQVAVIGTGGGAAALAAKAATTTIPIVFIIAGDPVRLGLVASLARPGGNLTGVNFLSAELVAKRLELLRELVPGTVRVAVLVNPAGSNAATPSDVETAARALGLQIQVFNTSTSREIDTALATFVRERPDALFVGSDPFFTARRVQLATLAARHMIPMTSGAREIAEAGGLMSYGANIVDAFRQAGAYTGRILKGAKPADLPVEQPTKFDLVINLTTAKALGIDVPPTLLARADEVIE